MRSRYGCAACKARKVKCDEIKPTCTNCQSFGIVCGQLASKQPGVHSRSTLKDSCSLTAGNIHDGLSSSIQSKRGRPRKFQKLNSQSVASRSVQNSPASCTAQERSYSVAEVQLLIHFTSHTAKTLSNAHSVDDPDYYHFTNVIPSLGLKDSFIFDFLCAIASMHMSFQATDASVKASHRTTAETYFQTGLSDYGKEFESRKRSGSAMYAAATLVCYYSLAAGPRNSSDVLVCDLAKAEEVTWLQLLYGVRALRETHAGPVAESTYRGTSFEEKRPAQRIQTVHVEDRWRGPLGNLRSMIQSESVSSAPVCLRMLEGMAMTFAALENKQLSTGEQDHENEQILGWLYKLEDGFVISVRDKEPIALIILAFYTVLLGMMEEHHWWIRGWADHILQVMCDSLRAEYESWLIWPKAEAQSRCAR